MKATFSRRMQVQFTLASRSKRNMSSVPTLMPFFGERTLLPYSGQLELQ